MRESFLIGLLAIILFLTPAQWISWRLKLPSILLLLIFGFIAGSVLKIIDPDILFCQILFPVISFSVAVILFEGELSLLLLIQSDKNLIVISDKDKPVPKTGDILIYLVTKFDVSNRVNKS